MTDVLATAHNRVFLGTFGWLLVGTAFRNTVCQIDIKYWQMGTAPCAPSLDVKFMCSEMLTLFLLIYSRAAVPLV